VTSDFDNFRNVLDLGAGGDEWLWRQFSGGHASAIEQATREFAAKVHLWGEFTKSVLPVIVALAAPAAESLDSAKEVPRQICWWTRQKRGSRV